MEHSLSIIKHVQKSQHVIPKVPSGCSKFTDPAILLTMEEIQDFFVNSSGVSLFIVE